MKIGQNLSNDDEEKFEKNIMSNNISYLDDRWTLGVGAFGGQVEIGSRGIRLTGGHWEQGSPADRWTLGAGESGRQVDILSRGIRLTGGH